MDQMVNMTKAQHEALVAARDALVQIMEANWVGDHHMDIGRAYHAVAKLTGYSQEAIG